jgi:hypothetical protein
MSVIQPKNKANLNLELKFRTTRVKTFVWIGKDTEPVLGYAFVSEVKKQAVATFLPRKLQITSIVLISFEEKDAQPFRAKVVRNQSQADKRNLQNASSDWKSSLTFEFSSDEEAERYLEFFVKLRNETAVLAHPDKQPKYKIVDGKTDDMNLDDALAGMDLGGDKPEGGESAA